MAVEVIRKRSGDIVPFAAERIARAIQRAWTEVVGQECPIAQRDHLTVLVTEQVSKQFNEEQIPSVEDIQDIVERTLAAEGHFAIARAYILYRERQAEKRAAHQQQTQEQLAHHQLTTRTRSGSEAPFSERELRHFLQQLWDAASVQDTVIDLDDVLAEVKQSLFDGITTAEILRLTIMALRARIERDPIYSSLASRCLLYDLYKDVLEADAFSPTFASTYREEFPAAIRRSIAAKRLDPRMGDFSLELLSDAIVPERDGLFIYLGMQTLYDRYLVRDLDQNILEVPQYFFMRVAMGLALAEPIAERDQRALDFYQVMSTLHYLPSTPTLFHAGTTHPQMSSCYISTVEDDLSHIFKVIADNAQLSKWSGGLGNDWTSIRGTGALIKSTNVGSQGVVPFLKIVDSTTAAINRSGKRRGATCVYLETWHYDIEDFLELRKNTGDERRRTHDCNTANWIPDLFFQRVEENADWTLFSPDETPDLHNLYGKAFAKRYEEYERQATEGNIRLFKTIPAKTLWRKMITMLFETGHPWMTFKDACNIRSPQDHVGVVHSSNLCTEITLNTSPEETAVCNLGSVNLAAHIDKGELDRERLARTVNVAMRMLDNVVDLNFYPTPEAKAANMRHRPIGVGMMGFQDALYKLGLSFASDDAVQFSDEVMEFISYHALLSSSVLAKERGHYESFRGSKWSRGLLPLDTLDMLEEERGVPTGTSKQTTLNWQHVREHIRQHGMRNSNCMAIAPTATISNIAGCSPTIEPIYKNLYVKSNVSGEFTVINRFLIEELKSQRLWDRNLLESLKQHDGSIQSLRELPVDLRERYREAFEIDPVWTLRHAAARGKWIDQSQSVNLFVATTSGKLLSDLYLAAWRMGLKTTYYLRTLGASAVEKSTIGLAKKTTQVDVSAPSCVVGDPECEACQ